MRTTAETVSAGDTGDAITRVKGTVVCDTNGSAGGGNSTLVDTPLVSLSAQGDAEFQGSVGPLPVTFFIEPTWRLSSAPGLKHVAATTPVFLKSISRIEALRFLHFVALLVHALIEREVRTAMAARGIRTLPLYPEARD